MIIKEYNQLIRYAQVMNADLVCKKEQVKCNNTIKQYKTV